jgi:sulfide dehydrogenase cytochrome subunit
MAVEAAPPAGQLLASQCAQCHGTNGGEIAGEGDLYDELMEWKYANEQEKIDHIMHWQVKAYTDAQLLLIADYFSSLPSTGDDD